MDTVNLLHHASLFLYVANADDIEAERLSMEAEYKQNLQVFSNETVTRSGARMTRITWECVR